MVAALVTGAAAGAGIGYVLQRGQLCFLSMFASALARRTLLLHGWLLGVAVASVGLSLLYLTAWSHGLNTGLPFTPGSDIAGGLLIGTGMAVASSCTSGLFTKLGSGMLGALVGLAGELAGPARPPARAHGAGPGPGRDPRRVTGVRRLALSVLFLALVAGPCGGGRPPSGPPNHGSGRRPGSASHWDW